MKTAASYKAVGLRLSELHWLTIHNWFGIAATDKHHRAMQFPVLSQKLGYLRYILPNNSFCACDCTFLNGFCT